MLCFKQLLSVFLVLVSLLAFAGAAHATDYPYTAGPTTSPAGNADKGTVTFSAGGPTATIDAVYTSADGITWTQVTPTMTWQDSHTVCILRFPNDVPAGHQVKVVGNTQNSNGAATLGLSHS